jgi:hypothetical protein
MHTTITSIYATSPTTTSPTTTSNAAYTETSTTTSLATISKIVSSVASTVNLPASTNAPYVPPPTSFNANTGSPGATATPGSTISTSTTTTTTTTTTPPPICKIQIILASGSYILKMSFKLSFENHKSFKKHPL